MAQQQNGNATPAPAGNGTVQVRLTKPDGNATPADNATGTPPAGNASAPVVPVAPVAPAGNASIQVPAAKKAGADDQGGGATQPDNGLVGTIVWLAVLTVVFVLMWRAGWINRIRVFAEETREQLRKCAWPTGSELAQHVVVVLLGTLMLGLFTMLSELIARETVWGALLNTKTLLFDKN